MSLKAKIEAVIYAAEEPVTLAQLVGLLGGEAQAELDHLAAAQQTLELEVTATGIPLPSEPELLNEEVIDVDELLELENAQDELDTPDRDAPDLDTAESLPAAEDHAIPTTVEIQQAPEESSADPAPAAAATPEPLDERQLGRQAKDRERAVREYFRRLLDELIRDYALGDRGLEIREVANGFRLATKPEYHDAVRGFAKSLKPPLKLSLQALETLAVVAYKQPITAPEISEIRGVDSGGVLGGLMARKLVSTAGRKQVIGRPILYKTTKDFLLRFGLKDIGDLPGIEEFEKMAGELAEADAIQEEIPMDAPKRESPEDLADADLREEADATEPQADGDSTEPVGVPVDGRMSGLDSAPADSEDTSAQEAEIQNEESAARREGTE